MQQIHQVYRRKSVNVHAQCQWAENKTGGILHVFTFRNPISDQDTFTVSVWFNHKDLSKQGGPTVQLPKSRWENRQPDKNVHVDIYFPQVNLLDYMEAPAD